MRRDASHRSSAVALTTIALILALAGCGSADGSHGSAGAGEWSTTVPGTAVDAEGYLLENPDPHEDAGDDMTIYSFGHAAGAAEARAITEVVNRYYVAAAANDGATACALTVARLARSLPEDYGEGAGPAYLRGANTCQAVMSRLFAHQHHELTGPTEVSGVRVEGPEGLVLLRSRTLRFVYTRVRREHGVWRFTKLIGAPLP